jgi:trimethylamine--corrinoid protein Co-methyltransferase
MISVLLGGMDMSENGQGLSAVREVGPGKHYLGSAHTLQNFETAFYRSTVADNNSFEQWTADGALDAAQRANGLWKKMLNEYEAPALDPATDEALQDFMTRRKSSFADRDY